ncbi:YaiI/YqxD family protein [Lentibacillus sp. CBA3610]|uniref:YaiI/YqxD family protein n=1 Tax=Lentibacillus sp. CBA3610 TaxID=2518176 RepID=UPI001595FA7A|nr:YaiI/YqxD family protein [Lentibacillus sp. CBA3610]QKY71057.1 YaiI/YqxD family protein [Lentibacillus sp. CBA3610]
MNVYVDADACPVKKTIITIAREFNVPVTLVKSFSHFSHDDDQPGVETVYVDTGAEAADYRIMQLVQQGDIIITQDYGLASLGLSKECTVLHHKGFTYTEHNIDQLLQSRYVNAMARKSGKRTKGPKAFTSEDEAKFRELFRETLETLR